jgi:hypothetical protein
MPTKKVVKKKVKKAVARVRKTHAHDWEVAFKKMWAETSTWWSKAWKPTRKPSGRSAHHYNDRWMKVGWFVPVVLLVVGAILMMKPKSRYVLNVTSAKLVGLFDRTKQMKTGDRVAFWSEQLFHDPNLLSTLGAGPEINDTAPLFPHGYDCTTFVETVGALSESNAGAELADNLIKIRYRDGVIGFATRNHFPEADWIPNNETAGVLKDITVQIARKAGFMAAFARKNIDKVSWFKHQKNESAQRYLASLGGSSATAAVQLPYLPLDQVMSALQHIPNGAIINVVRESKDRFPVLISHQGFLIWKNGVAYFRHASRNKEIRETPFNKYLKEARAMPWKVVGFNVNTFTG